MSKPIMFKVIQKLKLCECFKNLYSFSLLLNITIKMDNILYIYTSYYSFVFKIEFQ